MADILDFNAERAKRGGPRAHVEVGQYEPLGTLPATEVAVVYQVRTGLRVLSSCDRLQDAIRICRMQNQNTMNGRPLEAFVVRITTTVLIEDPYDDGGVGPRTA